MLAGSTVSDSTMMINSPRPRNPPPPPLQTTQTAGPDLCLSVAKGEPRAAIAENTTLLYSAHMVVTDAGLND